MKLNQLVRTLKLHEALSSDFRRFCELAAKCHNARTTRRMLWLVDLDDVNEFHSLLRKFKRQDRKIRRFARGDRSHRRRATCALVKNAHSFAYYV